MNHHHEPFSFERSNLMGGAGGSVHNDACLFGYFQCERAEVFVCAVRLYTVCDSKLT